MSSKPKYRTGYTLFELLIVLAIIGLMLGLTAPNLQRQYQLIERRSERDNILMQLSQLGIHAFTEGKNIVIPNDLTKKEGVNAPPLVDLPDGWNLAVLHPFQINFSGFCEGGSIDITDPDGEKMHITMLPPNCKPQQD